MEHHFISYQHSQHSLLNALAPSSHGNRAYWVVVESCEVATGRLYGAFVPDVPGCTATGTSIEQALMHIRASLLVVAHSLVKQGSMLPEAHTLEEHTAEYASEGAEFLTEHSILALVEVPVFCEQTSAQAA
jgi:predicted RNase H-like HicB family nuclease